MTDDIWIVLGHDNETGETTALSAWHTLEGAVDEYNTNKDATAFVKVALN